MSRSIWKGIFFSTDIYNYKKNNIFFNRQMSALPLFRDKTITIYNGKQEVPIKFNKEEMFNHCLGEFVFTKKKCVKVKKEKKNFKMKK